MQAIQLLHGMKIGHAAVDNRTGVSVILAPEGTVGGVSVKGCAPGTRETDLLQPEKAIERIDAIVLAGGSAFGLASCDGVMRYLKEEGIGHAVGNIKIPLVSGAVIFDVQDNGSTFVFPDSNTGYIACKNATDTPSKWGSVGVGIGATVGKILGAAHSQKGGLGAATVTLGDVFVTAITVCNALGDVVNAQTGELVAGVHDGNGNLLGTQNLILSGKLSAHMGGNTTLSCVITNAKLSKLQAHKLAHIAHSGYAKSINPVHTDYDGDTIFCLSNGNAQMDFTALSVMAVEAVSQSIVHSVKAQS